MLQNLYSSYLYDAVTRTFLDAGSTIVPVGSDAFMPVNAIGSSSCDIIAICDSGIHSIGTDDISSRAFLEKIHFSLSTPLSYVKGVYPISASYCQMLPFYSSSSQHFVCPPSSSVQQLNCNIRKEPKTLRAKSPGVVPSQPISSSHLIRSEPHKTNSKYSYYRFPQEIRSILIDWYKKHGGAKLCKEERQKLMEKTGLNAKQVSMFMINYRRRHE